MWIKLKSRFEKLPSQARVAQLMLALGLSVHKNVDGEYSIFCGDIQISPSQIGRTMKIDRRVVIETTRRIVNDPELLDFFSSLTPTANLGASSSKLGFGVLQIIPESPDQPGIIAGTLAIIARMNISVRQVIADDPELFDEPRATIVTEKPIPPEVVPEIRKVPGIKALVIM